MHIVVVMHKSEYFKSEFWNSDMYNELFMRLNFKIYMCTKIMCKSLEKLIIHIQIFKFVANVFSFLNGGLLVIVVEIPNSK